MGDQGCSACLETKLVGHISHIKGLTGLLGSAFVCGAVTDRPYVRLRYRIMVLCDRDCRHCQQYVFRVAMCNALTSRTYGVHSFTYEHLHHCVSPSAALCSVC